MSEWKTIESAPKDGTIILLYENNKDGMELGCCGVGVGFWMYQDPWKGEEYWADAYSMDLLMDNPTHWMPLPQPPKEYTE